MFVVALALGQTALSRADGPPPIRPRELVRRAIQNEIKTDNDTAKYMFRQRKETLTGSQIKLMVQTRDAMVGMVVANNDQPLDQEQRRAEYGRIERFLQPTWRVATQAGAGTGKCRAGQSHPESIARRLSV